MPLAYTWGEVYGLVCYTELMAKPFLSVIIPAYNESGRLPLTLVDIDRHLEEQDFAYEIIVVNDGSTDSTGEVVKRFQSLIKELTYINNPTNRGKGAALRIGMLAAKGTWCVSIDADNAVSIVEFTKALPYLKSGAVDIVVGSRQVRGASVKPGLPLHRTLAEYTLNWFARSMLKLPVKDTLAGFLCMSREVAHRIFSSTKCNRWSAELEAIAIGASHGLRIKEMPIFVSPKPDSHLRFGDYLQIMGEVFKMRAWIKKGRYSNS